MRDVDRRAARWAIRTHGALVSEGLADPAAIDQPYDRLATIGDTAGQMKGKRASRPTLTAAQGAFVAEAQGVWSSMRDAGQSG